MPANSELLRRLVEEFQREKAPGLREYLNQYRQMPRQQLVRDAIRSRRPDGRMHDHQCRQGRTLMDNLAQDVEPATELFLSAESFEEILELISQFRCHMVSHLTLYDIALRIGAGLDHLPKEVYLQCGAKQGARKLLGVAAVRGKRSLPVSAFPLELTGLTAYELENFLCHYRGLFDPATSSPVGRRRRPRC